MTFLSPAAEFLEEARIELEGVFGSQTFTWKNIEVPCSPSSLERGLTIVIGAKEVSVQFSIHVRRVNFFTADSTLVTIDSELFTVDNDKPTPVSGKKIVFNGKTYRILKTSELPDRGAYRLDLGDPNS